MMRAHGHGLPGGAHQLLAPLPGGQIGLDPRRDMHHRIPPVYNPETERQYPLRRYIADVGMWCLTTDLGLHQQAPAIFQRLQGQAREVAMLIPLQDLVGGVTDQNGNYVDPVSNLLAHLVHRFGTYPDEDRNEAVMQVWKFSRIPH